MLRLKENHAASQEERQVEAAFIIRTRPWSRRVVRSLPSETDGMKILIPREMISVLCLDPFKPLRCRLRLPSYITADTSSSYGEQKKKKDRRAI